MIQFNEVFQSSQSRLLKRLIHSLRVDFGYKYMRATKKFVYAEGTIPVLLVAHLDTVHRELPFELYHDKAKGVFWSPQGIGADDRAGVWGIIMLLKQGYRPHILFTTDEEIGGKGASSACLALKAPNVKFLVELDRKGSNDAVFYDCDNKDFTAYVESFGFKENWGSFSDISFLSPEWGIAGVNLSTGYYHAHTTTEYFNINELKATVEKVAMMFNKLPEKAFEYIESLYSGIGRTYNDAEFWDEYYLRKYGIQPLTKKEKGSVSYLSSANKSTVVTTKFACDLCGQIKDMKEESEEKGFCKNCYDKFYDKGEKED